MDNRLVSASIDECNRVAEDSLYTGQAHFEVAYDIERQRLPLLIFPAFLAGLCGILTAVGLPTWIGAVGAAAGLVAGVTASLGIDKKAESHERAGIAFTALRHDARFAEEMHSSKDPAEFMREVEALHKRYNDVQSTAPMTIDKAFERARTHVKAGRFKRDSEIEIVGPKR